MDVQATSGLLRKRFGHEACDEAVFKRRRFDCAFEQQCVIAGKDRVVEMLKIYLELPRRVLGSRGIRGNVLRFTNGVEVIEEVLDFPEVIGVVDLGSHLRPTYPRHPGRAWGRLIGPRVEQIEFEFGCHHDAQPHLVERLDGPLQHRAGIGKEGLAIGVEHAKQRLRRGIDRPGHRRDAAGHQPGGNVRVAVVISDHARNHVAEGAHQNGACAEPEAIVADFFKTLPTHALAAKNALNIRYQDLHRR